MLTIHQQYIYCNIPIWENKLSKREAIVPKLLESENKCWHGSPYTKLAFTAIYSASNVPTGTMRNHVESKVT